MDKKQSKPWYKKWWVWAIIIVVIIAIGGAAGSEDDSTQPSGNTSTSETNDTSAPEQKEEEPAKEWNLNEAYGKIKTGMTKAQVEKATAKDSESCYESEDPTFGKTEICNYGNAFIDKGGITVTYRQGEVASKSKHSY